MIYLVLFGLFLLKHAILSHVVDVGYSDARDPNARRWFIGLYLHSLAETAITALFLGMFHQPVLLILLAMALEHAVLAISALVERRAPLFSLLQYHLYSELAVAMIYGLIVTFIWMDPAYP